MSAPDSSRKAAAASVRSMHDPIAAPAKVRLTGSSSSSSSSDAAVQHTPSPPRAPPLDISPDAQTQRVRARPTAELPAGSPSLAERPGSVSELEARVARLALDRDAFREAYNEAMGELAGVRAELRAEQAAGRGLREQVRGLKSWVSGSGRREEQVSDGRVGEGWRGLGHGVMNWVIVHFRRARVDTDKANDGIQEHLMSLVPNYESLAASSKLPLIQSIISSLLMESIFEEYFVGLARDHAHELKKVEALFSSEESKNQWRSATLSLIRKDTEKLASHTNGITTHILDQANSILNAITDTQNTAARDSSLRALLNDAIDLSRLLRVQKAIFVVMMPTIEDHQRTLFDPATMEDIGGEDEETLQQREIACVTFPGIVKHGDENGQAVTHANDDLAALAACDSAHGDLAYSGQGRINPHGPTPYIPHALQVVQINAWRASHTRIVGLINMIGQAPNTVHGAASAEYEAGEVGILDTAEVAAEGESRTLFLCELTDGLFLWSCYREIERCGAWGIQAWWARWSIRIRAADMVTPPPAEEVRKQLAAAKYAD